MYVGFKSTTVNHVPSTDNITVSKDHGVLDRVDSPVCRVKFPDLDTSSTGAQAISQRKSNRSQSITPQECWAGARSGWFVTKNGFNFNKITLGTEYDYFVQSGTQHPSLP